MEKTKKMSKLSIAVIVLSILLVLSMVMGMTGAWFTSHDGDGSGNLTFGKVKIDVTDTAADMVRWESEHLYLMPGDHMNDFVITNTSDVEAYVRYKIEIVVTGAKAAADNKADWENTEAEGHAAAHEPTQAELNLIAVQSYFDAFYGNGYHYVVDPGTSAQNDYCEVADTASTTLPVESSTANQVIAPLTNIYVQGFTVDGNAVGNFAQETPVVITLTVEAIQVANMASANAAWALYRENGIVTA